MIPEAYDAFTRQLQQKLEAEPRVLGLVALGSMAAQDYGPDHWSDHDFFVIVEVGAQEDFRAELAWLPDAERVILAFRETAHGLKVLYDDGHLLEFAVFDTEELHLARVNRYRVLLDRGEIEQHLTEIANETKSQADTSSDEFLVGQFLTSLLVGVGRYQRGERLSGTHFVKTSALRHLLVLLARHVPSRERAKLDNLDPLRRFEMAYPALGAELGHLLGQATPAAAEGLLAIAGRELAARLPDYPVAAEAAVRRSISTVAPTASEARTEPPAPRSE